MTNALLVMAFTLGDSLCGCLQVYNLVHRRRLAAFFVSVIMGTCKILAVIITVKSSDPMTIAGYLAGGAIGAQISMFFRPKEKA